MKKNFKKSTILFLLTASIMVQPTVKSLAEEVSSKSNVVKSSVISSQDYKAKLNNYFYGLNYDSENILTHNGESITTKFPTTGKNSNNEFIVVEKIKKNLTHKNADVSIMTSSGNRVFPGAILRADKGLLENNPTVISLNRSPLKVSIDLPGMTNNSNGEVVENPTNSNIRGAINTLTDRWNSTYASLYPNVAAKISYTETMAKSMNQLKAQFGLGFEKMGLPLNIDFDALASGEKQACVVHFKQVYYNVSIDTPASPADFFAPSVSVENLKNAGINEKTPPVYVSDVSYGRSMFIKLETSSKSAKVHAAFQALIKGVDVKADAEFQHILDNTSFTAVILGGDSGEATKVVSGKVEDLKEIIKSGSRYNRETPAVPVSYRTAFVKDNEPAIVNSSSDYIETKVTSYRNGELVLKHTGGYIAKFFVTWDELTYDENGKEILVPKAWEDNGKSRTAGFSVTIPLKGNVRNLSVKAIEKTGLIWEPWRTVYNKEDIQLAKHREIWIWGTTLNPKMHDIVTND
ncbi:MAG: thiol-activated cytolysin family protein [Peptoniphilaceae bacterium]|uniref:thiol-activated cytolysin family protein n=1 Tax=Parvimonas sp. TaxID=1944660 RepID=UPI0025F8A2EC|nr:thiol-activated cytolysin family protein [Parvimonas sp.]MCI5996627.1 thiol-activated cytolysin family protein [Parvimonas sp.]MDD7765249.1 thiol-activated cytolysin family protein [Peptoniphilaceae bacterium]MDY3051331.1 thiol-activated cytolysin family protein [Parvimonas sp.]